MGLAFFFLFYILFGGVGQGLAIIPGISITFWPPAGIFVAVLLSHPGSSWPWWVATGCLAELVCNALWFHNPIHFAMIYYVANALEALTAAWLIGRFSKGPFRLATLSEVATFVILGAGVAPIIGATLIGLTDAARARHSFATAWPLVWLGDASGLLVTTPLTLVVIHTWRNWVSIPTLRILEALFVLILLIVVGGLSFRGYLPTAYMMMPPLLWAGLRFQLKGGAAALAIVTLVTAFFTMAQEGEFSGSPELLHQKVVMLQTFLAISAISLLIVAGLSQQHQDVLRALQMRADQALLVSQRRFETLADGSPVLLWVHGPDGCEFVNRAYLGFLGLRSDVNIRGEKWQQYVHPDDRQRYTDSLRAARSALTNFECECRFQRFDGQWRWMRSEATPRRDENGIVKYVGATVDITDRKVAEDALRDVDRRKDEFLATLAHELRNPLAPVRNAVQVLHVKSPFVPELQWARDVIDRQMQAMTRLIDDLMDLSRINRGIIELKCERVQLDAVIQGAIETSRPLIEQMNHELSVTLPPEPVFLQADLTRLSQVFLNLLNNAAKYMERGGHIEVRAEREGSDVVVSVKDHGIGIPADKLPSIFEMFSQVEGALSRSQGGLGIGLSLVKRLIEMHGGSVSAHSAGLGHGSEFVVRLPLAVDHEYSSADSLEPDTCKLPTGIRILVVDDNKDAADSLAMLLRIMGNSTQTAHEGNGALDVAESFRPQVVLCDIGLPGLNGYEVCDRIRQREWGRKVVMIAITGWGQDGDRQRSQAAGFDHHLVKPVDPQVLMSLLAELDLFDAPRSACSHSCVSQEQTTAD